ncbi:MAG: hypothetical protein NXI31_09185 [bacterium]|nr:hypothetical protein [bacterium]
MSPSEALLLEKSIVFRTTATGALCLLGAVGSTVGFGASGPWVPFCIAGAGVLVMWLLGRSLRESLEEVQRIHDVALMHHAETQQRTEVARAMAASLADRALAQSRQIRGDPEHLKVQEILDATFTLTERLSREIAAVIERLGDPDEPEPSRPATELVRLAAAAKATATTAALHARQTEAGNAAPFNAVTTALDAVVDAAASTEVVDLDLLPEVSKSLGRMLDALRTMHEGLEVVEQSPGAHQVAADSLAAICVDARFIDRELSSLQGARPDDAVSDVSLPPHPLDWDQLDAAVREDTSDDRSEDGRDDVQAPAEAGNMNHQP